MRTVLWKNSDFQAVSVSPFGGARLSNGLNAIRVLDNRGKVQIWQDDPSRFSGRTRKGRLREGIFFLDPGDYIEMTVKRDRLILNIVQGAN